jgi:pimeloyl-ACP methyl ester carboxylesterase
MALIWARPRHVTGDRRSREQHGTAFKEPTPTPPDHSSALRDTPTIQRVAPVTEGQVPLDRGRLYYRDIGAGHPVIVLHGGPDFDHSYLVPELDRLARSHRLIYFDQRGRGRSAEGVRPEDVGLLSEIEDVERLRRHLQLPSAAILGHSWGGLLAMEYALRHPDRTTHLILMNTARASRQDWSAMRQHFIRIRPAGDVERMRCWRRPTGSAGVSSTSRPSTTGSGSG